MTSSLFLPRMFAFLIVGMALLAGTQIAYSAESPADAEERVEQAELNATENMTDDTRVNATVLRMTERTFAVAEWWAPRYYPHTHTIPYWGAQLALGAVATAPITRLLYATYRQQQEAREP